MGIHCRATQVRRLGFSPGNVALLSSNTQSGLLPLCETGVVVLTVKNASAQSEAFDFVITDTLKTVSYVSGSAKITVLDDSGALLVNNLPFTPTNLITISTGPLEQQMLWEFSRITNSYPITVQDVLRNREASDTIIITFSVQTRCESQAASVHSAVSA